MNARTDQEACDLLDRLVLASPCSVTWDQMVGDNRKRLCGGCSRYVHNISDMTKAEAEQFLRENGTSQCTIFYRRFDGTIMTDDCPVGLRKIREAYRFVHKIAASLVVMLLSIPGAIAQQLQTPKSSQDQERTAKQMSQFCALDNPGEQGTKLPLIPIRNISQPSGSAGPPMPGVAGFATVLPRDTERTILPILNSTTTPGTQGTTHQNPTQIPKHPKLDTTAHTYYEKGRAATAAGKKSLANFYYQKALDAFDAQRAGDEKFRQELVRAVEASRD